MKVTARMFCASILAALPAFGQATSPAGGGGAPAATAPAAVTTAPATPRAPKPESDVVQLAILLDTSGSMNGLIDQAKTELWGIVNEVAKAQTEGQKPDIQVALYQYGSPSLGAATGYIKQCVPLTNDLDKVSAELHKLTISGGEEYCGWVIKTAVEELKWSDEKGAYKAIFIAGNEPFTQGTVDYHEACKLAVSKGIVVHTIYCGPEQTGIATGWKDGSTLGDGSYSFINQNIRLARTTPQDKELADLSAKLNGTYVPYGAGGQAGATNQAAQDKNASSGAGSAAVAAERAITKANAAYRNATWDLVDAVKDGKVVLADLKPEDLPEEMRKLDAQGRADYLAQKQKERETIQAQIKQLSQDRDKYIASLPAPAVGAPAAGGGRGGGGGFGGGGGAGGAGGSSFGGAVGRAAGGRGG